MKKWYIDFSASCLVEGKDADEVISKFWNFINEINYEKNNFFCYCEIDTVEKVEN